MHTSFYDEMSFLRYPFKEVPPGGDSQLPTSVILDAGIDLEAGVDFDPHTHDVRLDSVAVDGVNLTIVVRVGEDQLLEFAGEIGDSPQVLVAENNDGLCGQPAVHGFLVVGDTTGLADWLLLHTPAPEEHVFQPSVVRNYDKTYVASVGVANAPPVLVEGYQPGLPDIPLSSCLTQQLRLRAGSNCLIGKSSGSNSIVFSAKLGVGEPHCGEDPASILDDLTVLPPGLSRQTRRPWGSQWGAQFGGGRTVFLRTVDDQVQEIELDALRCRHTIAKINGVTGRHLTLAARYGIEIASSPETHTIKVKVLASQLGSPPPQELTDDG